MDEWSGGMDGWTVRSVDVIMQCMSGLSQESGACGTPTSQPTSTTSKVPGVPTSSSVLPTGNLTTTDAVGRITPTFVTPTTAIPILKEVVDGSQEKLRLTGLRHFTDYTIMVIMLLFKVVDQPI